MRSMGIGRQLVLLVGAFSVAVAAAVGGLSYLLHDSVSGLKRLTESADRQNRSLFALVGSVGKVQSATQRLLREKDPDVVEKLIEQSRTLAAEAGLAIREAGAGSSAVASSYRQLEAANGRVVDNALRGDYAEAQRLLIEESAPRFEALLESVRNLEESGRARREEGKNKDEARASSLQAVVYVLVIAASGALAGGSFVLVRRVNASLCRAAANLKETANQMASAAGQVSSTSQSLAQGSSSQAASLEQTSASTAEINAMTSRNAENARTAVQAMAETARIVTDANVRLEQMVESMARISASSEKISKIIKVIDQIAFQTNILALNAAVEAARAGEAGLGFAVVADEVRNLAQRSAQAARDTTSLIEESVSLATEGSQRLGRVATSIRGITETAEQVKSWVDQVSQGSQEQAHGIKEIARAIANMEQVTQRSAADAEESAAAGEQLNAQAQALRAVVDELNELVGA